MATALSTTRTITRMMMWRVILRGVLPVRAPHRHEARRALGLAVGRPRLRRSVPRGAPEYRGRTSHVDEEHQSPPNRHVTEPDEDAPRTAPGAQGRQPESGE